MATPVSFPPAVHKDPFVSIFLSAFGELGFSHLHRCAVVLPMLQWVLLSSALPTWSMVSSIQWAQGAGRLRHGSRNWSVRNANSVCSSGEHPGKGSQYSDTVRLSIGSHPCLVEGSRVCDLCCGIPVPRADDWQMTGASFPRLSKTLRARCEWPSEQMPGTLPVRGVRWNATRTLVWNHTCSNKPRLLVL